MTNRAADTGEEERGQPNGPSSSPARLGPPAKAEPIVQSLVS